MGENTSVICMGELLIDFFCTDVDIDLERGKNFEKQAGGAPANVCATIVKLGGYALFSGKVGNDPFGHFLKNTLDEVKVDTSMLVLDKINPTTLAFVSLKKNGERDFVFNRGADALLLEEELDQDKMEQASILHFGSATALLEEPFRTTYYNSLRSAKERGQFISFDPNYRLDLWKGRESIFVDLVKQGISLADFVKVSEEELKIITGTEELESGVQILHALGAKIVAITLGKRGTLISNRKKQETIPSIPVDSIDSTGAGDAFVGAALFQFSKGNNAEKILEDFQLLKEIILFSNKVGALVCTKVGAITSIPTLEEVI
ncbi:carbohydrate kinase [Sutcliffiella horikoshii]|uniref:carbohydrate kinase family protein n=1 Tax=Sutcliffiella horikoshii TaxID=79883 RepID=UPI00385137C9